MRERAARVSFGQNWVRESILELIREDLARFRVLLGASLEEDSLEVLARGGLPTLQALRTHTGTVYRWNRACFGIGEGRAHVRIENRVLPSGPHDPGRSGQRRLLPGHAPWRAGGLRRRGRDHAVP